MIWVIVALIASPVAVRMGFMGICTAKRLRDSGLPLSRTDKVAALLCFAIGYPADIIYNLSVGRLRFGEFRGFTYSSRIQYYIDHDTFMDDASKRRKVVYWYTYLNVADPGHIKAKP